MLGVELRPTAYRVKSLEPIVGGYLFGTVAAGERSPIGVVTGPASNVRVDRYQIENPQSWLADLANLSSTSPESARGFILRDGVVDYDAVMQRAHLPKPVREFWKRAGRQDSAPFALSVLRLWRAQQDAKAKLQLATQARDQDGAGLLARISLAGWMSNSLKPISIRIVESSGQALVACVDPETLEQAVDLSILAYHTSPEIARCVECCKFFRRSKPKQRFCEATCKNRYHVKRFRSKGEEHAKRSNRPNQ